MTDTMKLNASLSLPFERAGVEFRIEVGDGDGDAGPGFTLTTARPETGTRIAFVSAESPVLADWVRGYTRWLYRCRISATHTDDAITGAFASGVTAEQVLEGLQLACDMIRQRFELYDDSVVME